MKRALLTVPILLGAGAVTLLADRDEPRPPKPATTVVAHALARQDDALETRAALARNPERLAAVYRDARSAAQRARRDLATVRGRDARRLDAVLAERAEALTAVIDGRGGNAALRTLTRTSAHLRLHEGTRR